MPRRPSLTVKRDHFTMSVAALGLTQGPNWLQFLANMLKLQHTTGPSDCVKTQVKVSFSAEEKLGL